MTEEKENPFMAKGLDTALKTVIDAIKDGTLDEHLVELTHALAERNDVRKEQVRRMVAEVFGEDYVVSKPSENPPPRRTSAPHIPISREAAEAQQREDDHVLGGGDAVVRIAPSPIDEGDAREFESTRLEDGGITAYGSDFRADRGGIAPATATTDVGEFSEGGGDHVRVSHQTVLGGGQDIITTGARIGEEQVGGMEGDK